MLHITCTTNRFGTIFPLVINSFQLMRLAWERVEAFYELQPNCFPPRSA